MGGLSILLALGLAYTQPQLLPAGDTLIVMFKDTAGVETLARTLCLRFGCRVAHTYPALGGAALEGGDADAIRRHPSVRSSFPDIPVSLDAEADKLVGAPSDGPLVVIGGALENSDIRVTRTFNLVERDAPMHDDATAALLRPLSNQGRHTFWNYVVLDAYGDGQLSTVYAALDETVSRRYAIGAIYIPLSLHGNAPVDLCAVLNAVLRKGLLVVTRIDASCPMP